MRAPCAPRHNHNVVYHATRTTTTTKCEDDTEVTAPASAVWPLGGHCWVGALDVERGDDEEGNGESTDDGMTAWPILKYDIAAVVEDD